MGGQMVGSWQKRESFKTVRIEEEWSYMHGVYNMYLPWYIIYDVELFGIKSKVSL